MYKSGKGEEEGEKSRVVQILRKERGNASSRFLREATSDRTKNANGAMHALVYITN